MKARSTFAPLVLALLVACAGAFGASFDAEISAFETADAVTPPPANVIPFVGSSSIKMWPNLAAAFPRHPVLNRGFGGSEMDDVLYYFDRVVARYQPPLVVVYEGDNDLASGKSVAQVFADYSNFVGRVQQELPATDIAFISVKPSPSRVSLLAKMAELNALIAGLCDGRRIRYVDVYTAMLDGNGQPRPELFGSDNLHMNAAGYALWNSIVGPALDAWASASGGTFLLDFGSNVNPTDLGPAPDDPANRWNNVTESIGSVTGAQLTNLVTVDNSQTAMNLVVASRFNSANANGVTASPLFPADAVRDSLYGNTEVFNGQSNIFPAFKITGLDTQSVYHFTFFASRTNSADNRETIYTAQGSNTATAALDAANNVSNVGWIDGMVPTAAGEIMISLAPSANNNNANHFTYLGVMKMDAIPPQKPISFLREPSNTVVAEGQPASFRAAVAGSPPFYIQWFSNGVAVPGANALTYTIPMVDFGMSGSRFSVSISNLAYQVASSNALLTVVTAAPPVEITSQVLLLDFGGANTTSYGASPDDPANYWNNITTAVASSATGTQTNFVASDNSPTTIGLSMISRFNGANENGTTVATLFPVDATRDSLFGNTETFNGLANIFPQFKLTGLNPTRAYRLTFFASRTGVNDNRETLYTIAGAVTNTTVLNAANNVSNVAVVPVVQPSAAGEIAIGLTPGSNNNNANHFTYLGVLKLEMLPRPRHRAPRIQGGNIVLEWNAGTLEWAPTITGPWQVVQSSESGAHSESVATGSNRFYRLRQP